MKKAPMRSQIASRSIQDKLVAEEDPPRPFEVLDCDALSGSGEGRSLAGAVEGDGEPYPPLLSLLESTELKADRLESPRSLRRSLTSLRNRFTSDRKSSTSSRRSASSASRERDLCPINKPCTAVCATAAAQWPPSSAFSQPKQLHTTCKRTGARWQKREGCQRGGQASRRWYRETNGSNWRERSVLPYRPNLRASKPGQHFHQCWSHWWLRAWAEISRTSGPCTCPVMYINYVHMHLSIYIYMYVYVYIYIHYIYIYITALKPPISFCHVWTFSLGSSPRWSLTSVIAVFQLRSPADTRYPTSARFGRNLQGHLGVGQWSKCTSLATYIWGFPKIGGTPKSSILVGVSIIKPSTFGYPHLCKPSYIQNFVIACMPSSF